MSTGDDCHHLFILLLQRSIIVSWVFCSHNDVCQKQPCHSRRLTLCTDRTTYVSGCTDPDFTDPSCPPKDTSHQQLLGLVQCEDSEVASGSVLWSGCPGSTTKTALGAPGQCSCSGTTSGLITWTSSLEAVASLGSALGETISFVDTATVTSKAVGAASTAAASTSASSAVPANTTPLIPVSTSIPPSSTPSTSAPVTDPLSVGAKAGIGIGSTALAVCVLGLGFVVYIWRRRARKATSVDREGLKSKTDSDGPPAACFSPDPYLMHSPELDGSELGRPRASLSGHEPYKPYRRNTSELPAELQYTPRLEPAELPVENMHLRFPADAVEVPASPMERHQSDHPRAMHSVSSVSPSEVGTIDPRTSESMSDVSSLHMGTHSPPSAGGVWERSGGVLPVRDGAGSALTPISEGHGWI